MIRAFGDDKERVWCDNCGDEIEHCGWMACTDRGHEVHYCDDCAPKFDVEHEFRICMGCGEPMVEGMTNLETVYVCEECFEPWMDENCPGGWREVDDDGYDGYYEERIGGELVGTGIFYTTWY